MKVSARVLSVLLVLCLLAGMLPARAADEWAEDDIEPVPPVEDMEFEEPEDEELPEIPPEEEPDESVGELFDTSGECGPNLTWVLDDEGTLTISGTGEMESYRSSSNVPWSQNRSAIRTVVIAEGVTSIGGYAFYNCANLNSVTIPNSVTSMWGYAFSGCSGLTNVTVPNRVTSIEAYVFSRCTKLTSVTIPDSVTSIGTYAFQNCSGLTSVNISNSVASIGVHAFDGCTKLASVTIPDSVTSIGNYAFSGCSGLTSVTISNSVTSIGSSVFQGCSGLTSVTIPECVTSIGGYAFYGCTGLTSVMIPNSVTSIGYNAFFYCSKLTSVTIPNSVKSIGDSAFYGCSELTGVMIPDSVTSIGNLAFDACSPNLRIYCYPDSYALTYAEENHIRYVLLSRDEGEVSTWLTSNASRGTVVGTEFLVWAGYSAVNTARLQINLPESITLSSVWLDGEELTEDSYTRKDGSLSIPLTKPELAQKPAHTVYLYCTATAAGSCDIVGTLTLWGEEERPLGTIRIPVDPLQIDVPEKVGRPTGIIARGKTNPNCKVTLFVDGKEAGHTDSNHVGSWQIPFDLEENVISGFPHPVYAEIQRPDGETFRTEVATVTYQECPLQLRKVTMYNTSDHGPQETEFDFTGEKAENLIRYYRIWPTRYPSFTFKLDFSGDPSTSREIFIVTTDSAGNETTIPAIYDPFTSAWAANYRYETFQSAPVWVKVVYDGISSNKLSVVPIMDPSGYIYEAVPSNRLTGVEATIFCEADGGKPWNAENFDQINPQTTGVDGSYYWDVPAGNWQVTFTKEGYKNAATEWLPVPPPQVDINVPMISTAAPKVEYAAVYEDSAEITFSQYMNIESVKGAVTLNGTTATVEALDAEYADETTQYATRFKATAANLSGDVITLAVGKAKNYAKTEMQDNYTETFSVEERPTDITASEPASMEMSAEQSIRVTLEPGISGQTLNVENLTPAIISVSETSFTTGIDGVAEIPVTALLPGTGILRITEPGSGLETTVSIPVEPVVALRISNASLDGDVLHYEITNAPANAKLIVAGYKGQQMGTVTIDDELSGTLALHDESATSYTLFLVDPDTMKPLCPNVTVPARQE